MKPLVILISVCASGIVYGQASPTYTAISHATIAHQNGMIHIHAASPWPVEQALSAVRREYGLVLDYEEGPSDENSQFVWAGNQRRWKGGDYLLQVPEPDTSSSAYARRLVLDVLAQFAAQGERRFTMIDGPNNRITVVPADPAIRILDTPVVIPPQKRMIDATIEAIFSAVKAETGSSIERAGLVDNETASKEVVVGNQTPVAARVLLAEALDSASYRRVWVQTWEPSTSTYALAVEPAVREVNSAGGQTTEVPIR